MRDVRTINYASPPAGHYWRWNAAYDAIEWEDGSTLALWQEVQAVLEELRESGIPPLGSVLLVIGACRDESAVAFDDRIKRLFNPVVARDQSTTSSANAPGETADPQLPMKFDIKVDMTYQRIVEASLVRDSRGVILAGFAAIQQLPRELRSSLAAKCLIASTVFTKSNLRLSKQDTRTVLGELSGIGPPALAGTVPRYDSGERLTRDLKALLPGLKCTPDRLESVLRTGLEEAGIDPATLPDSLSTKEDPRDLLDALRAAGGECGMAAAVAKRAIAMMNFPGHIGTPRDLPVGGIADITNRGTIDKLLPHELAWDDLVLAARLVHNEALYFRREIPPLNVVVAHTILLDRELRLWGTGRVLSLGIALGLWHHPGLNSPGGSFECVASTDTDFEHLELDSPAKVASALQTLVPTGSPDAFLKAWWDGAQIVDDPALPDVSLIIGKWHLEVETTRRLLGQIATWLHSRNGRFRILAIGREGDVEAQAWTSGGNRLLFRGEIDVEEILNGPAKPQPREAAPEPLRVKTTENPLLAVSPIYGLNPLPFLFPLKPSGSAFIPFGGTGKGGIGISTNGFLAEWPKEDWGARLLSAKLPGRQRWLGLDAGGFIIVVTSGDTAGDGAHVLQRDKDGTFNEIELEKSFHSFPIRAAIAGDVVILAYSDEVEALSLTTGRRLTRQSIKGLPPQTVFDFDGERILLHAGTTEEVVRSARHAARLKRPVDPTWPEMIVPTAVSLMGGILRVSCGYLIYEFDPWKLAWSLANEKHYGFTPLRPMPFEGVPDMTGAQLGKLLNVWHDPRGILHLRDTDVPGEVAWSIMLSSPACSVWSRMGKESELFGLCSMDERLRPPGEAAAGDFPKNALHEFLSWEPFQSHAP